MNKYKFVEEDKIYLTSSIFSYNKKLYYEDEQIIKITSKNCFKFLAEYGWEKIDKGWAIRLGNKKFCRFGILECGGEGDCLFHCISEALNNTYRYENIMYSCSDIRKIAAKQVNSENFELILENYKIMNKEGEFDGYWDPDEIKTIESLRNEIKKTGDNFWGDHIIIQLLQEGLQKNIVLLNSEHTDYFGDSIIGLSNEKKYTIHPLAHHLEKYEETIFLYYISGWHFLLVGYFNGSYMQTIFKTKNIPKELYEVYRRDCKII